MTDPGEVWSAAVFYEQATPEQLQSILDVLDNMSSPMLDVVSAWMEGSFTLSFAPLWEGNGK